ncbi:MAG: hypothetical protein WC205_03045 [Opitutaceae bacterium]|jgi:hypothetical protein
MRTLALFFLLTLSLTVAARAVETPEWFAPTSAWQFNSGLEFPGATGSFAIVSEAGRAAGRLDYDFTAGGRYVGALLSREIDPAFAELRLRMKATTPCKLIVRLIDSHGEVFQYARPCPGTTGWTDYRIDLSQSTITYADGKNGVADKIIDFPLRGLLLGVEVRKDSQSKGEALFSNIELVQ